MGLLPIINHRATSRFGGTKYTVEAPGIGTGQRNIFNTKQEAENFYKQKTEEDKNNYYSLNEHKGSFWSPIETKNSLMSTNDRGIDHESLLRFREQEKLDNNRHRNAVEMENLKQQNHTSNYVRERADSMSDEARDRENTAKDAIHKEFNRRQNETWDAELARKKKESEYDILNRSHWFQAAVKKAKPGASYDDIWATFGRDANKSKEETQDPTNNTKQETPKQKPKGNQKKTKGTASGFSATDAENEAVRKAKENVDEARRFAEEKMKDSKTVEPTEDSNSKNNKKKDGKK